MDSNLAKEQEKAFRADVLYKMLAANGYIISLMDDLKHQGQFTTVFNPSFASIAKKFYKQCLIAESHVTSVRSDDSDEAMEQLHNSYVMMDNVLTLVLHAGRKLTPEAPLLLNDELEALAGKYGVRFND